MPHTKLITISLLISSKGTTTKIVSVSLKLSEAFQLKHKETDTDTLSNIVFLT